MNAREHISKTFTTLFSNYTKDSGLVKSSLQELIKAYSKTSRHYHNLNHISSMLTEMELIKDQINDIDSLKFSILYHDIIYKASKSNNEVKSAEYFKSAIQKTSFDRIEKCVNQIELTKLHDLSDDHDINLLMDLDLCILGSDAPDYKIYCDNIRKEYAIYPEFLHNKGRAKVLKHFLESRPIFKTLYFTSKYETQAVFNISAELETLKAN